MKSRAAYCIFSWSGVEYHDSAYRRYRGESLLVTSDFKRQLDVSHRHSSSEQEAAGEIIAFHQDDPTHVGHGRSRARRNVSSGRDDHERKLEQYEYLPEQSAKATL